MPLGVENLKVSHKIQTLAATGVKIQKKYSLITVAGAINFFARHYILRRNKLVRFSSLVK